MHSSPGCATMAPLSPKKLGDAVCLHRKVNSMKSKIAPGTSERLPRQILLFSLPLMASNVLQVLFNMADIAVIGRFAGSLSMAAVGSTATAVTLFTGILIGVGGGINALVAIGAMNEAQRMGYRVPEDLSFVGIDGIELSSLVTPRLTTYRSNASELGKKAFEMLCKLIETGEISSYTHSLTLQEGESVRDLKHV